MAILREGLKQSIKEVIEEAVKGYDSISLERLDDVAWNRITDKLEGELRQIGIKVE